MNLRNEQSAKEDYSMKKFMKAVGILVTSVLLVKGILCLIDYLYETYSVKYIESDLPSED